MLYLFDVRVTSMLRREKRRVRRILVSVDAEVKIASPGGVVSNPAPIVATVTNLSTTGLSMRLPEVQPIGTMLRVSVKLKDKQAMFFAAVRRVYPATAYHPSQYGHGLQIVAAAEEAVDAIYEYMMNVTGRSALIEKANTVEAFPAAAVVNAGSIVPITDPSSTAPPVPSQEQSATPA
jgi:hypothetical protein